MLTPSTRHVSKEDAKGWTMVNNAQVSGNNKRPCFKCHELGHYSFECPKRKLHKGNEEDGDEIVDHECDQESGDNLEEDEEYPVDTSYLNVVKRILMSPKIEEKEEWLRTAIFHTQVKCGGKVCKLIIDGGSSMESWM